MDAVRYLIVTGRGILAYVWGNFPLKHAVDNQRVKARGQMKPSQQTGYQSICFSCQHDVISCGTLKVSQKADLIGPHMEIAGFNLQVCSLSRLVFYMFSLSAMK